MAKMKGKNGKCPPKSSSKKTGTMADLKYPTKTGKKK